MTDDDAGMIHHTDTGRTSNVVNIDETRQELFTKKGQHMDDIPPTRAALAQHIKESCVSRRIKHHVYAIIPQDWN